jgi:hypothetical protein
VPFFVYRLGSSYGKGTMSNLLQDAGHTRGKLIQANVDRVVPVASIGQGHHLVLVAAELVYNGGWQRHTDRYGTGKLGHQLSAELSNQFLGESQIRNAAKVGSQRQSRFP